MRAFLQLELVIVVVLPGEKRSWWSGNEGAEDITLTEVAEYEGVISAGAHSNALTPLTVVNYF